MSALQVDIEKILGVATTVASGMGLDSNLFQEALKLELSKLLPLESTKESTKVRTYTLEFLRALAEGGDNSSPLLNAVPKVGTENPKYNPTTTHAKNCGSYVSHQKGKYKPRVELELGDKNFSNNSNNSVSRDIVRSQPAPVVQRNENAWMPTKSKKAENDPLKIKLNKIRSDLNKISTDNENVISDRVCEEFTEECVAELISTFFDKGVWEQKYREIYARLCVRLSLKFPKVFMSALLLNCQKEFEITPWEDAEDDDIMLMMKRRMGAIHFIVEMLRVDLLKPGIIVLCANKILASSNVKTDHDICHVAELVIVSTPIIKQKDVIEKLRGIVRIISALHEKQFVSQRSKFKIEDAVKVLSK